MQLDVANDNFIGVVKMKYRKLLCVFVNGSEANYI